MLVLGPSASHCLGGRNQVPGTRSTSIRSGRLSSIAAGPDARASCAGHATMATAPPASGPKDCHDRYMAGLRAAEASGDYTYGLPLLSSRCERACTAMHPACCFTLPVLLESSLAFLLHPVSDRLCCPAAATSSSRRSTERAWPSSAQQTTLHPSTQPPGPGAQEQAPVTQGPALLPKVVPPGTRAIPHRAQLKQIALQLQQIVRQRTSVHWQMHRGLG